LDVDGAVCAKTVVAHAEVIKMNASVFLGITNNSCLCA
jgi:hypothetical protein